MLHSTIAERLREQMKLSTHVSCEHHRLVSMQLSFREAVYLFIYQCCYWQAIEAVCKCFPESNIVTPFAFIIEAINSIDGSAFMIASEQEEVLRILDLQDHIHMKPSIYNFQCRM